MWVILHVLMTLIKAFLLCLSLCNIFINAQNCYRGDEYEYENPCSPGQMLEYCPRGFRLEETCTERCVYCEEGVTFSDTFTNCLTCKRCRTECPEGQVIKKPCTITSDAVCACPECPTISLPTCPSQPQCPTPPTATNVSEISPQPQVPLEFTRNCSSGIEVEIDDEGSYKSVLWDEPLTTAGSKIVHQTYSPGHDFPEGHFEVLYVFANDSGVTISCSFPITVKALVKPTEQSLCGNSPVEWQLFIGFLVGVFVTLVVLLLVWLSCYFKNRILKRLCPRHKEENEEVENAELRPFIDNGPRFNGHNDQPDRDQCGGNLIPPVQDKKQNSQEPAEKVAQAEGGSGDNKDSGNQQNDQEPAGKVAPAGGDSSDNEDSDIDSEKNPSGGLANDGQATAQQQGYDQAKQDDTQLSSVTDKSSSLSVALPPETESSETPSSLRPSSSQTDPTTDVSQQPQQQPAGATSLPSYENPTTDVSQQPQQPAGATSLPSYQNVVKPSLKNAKPSLTNPDVEVTEQDLEWIAETVAYSPFYDKKDTFIRKMIGYGSQSEIEENLGKTDRQTRIFKFLKKGWLDVAPSRKQSDLAAKLGEFNKSLETQFIRHCNGEDKHS